MRTGLRRALAATLAVLLSVPVHAGDEAFELFEEEAKVVSASRREERISESPLAVDVVTREDIAASGAVDLWDLLRFRAGMDVLDGRSIDGNRAVVSERGFPHEFAGNLLVLVDGRTTYSVNQGGVYWEQMPVQLQDVERIEIVRGPNAALYGTGAGVGVVNIVTRRPTARTEASAGTRAGSGGLLQSEASSGFRLLKKASARVSHTWRRQDGAPKSDASAVSPDDELRKNVLNGRVFVPLSDAADLDLSAGGAWTAAGQADGASGHRTDFSNSFQAARLSIRAAADSTVEASASRSDYSANSTATSLQQDTRQLQHDAEALHRFAWLDGRFQTAYGLGYRNVRLRTPATYGARRPLLEIERGFAQQSVRVNDRLTLHGAASWESSNVAGVQPSWQAAAVVKATPAHALRASYSEARTLRDFIPIYADYRPDSTTRILGDQSMTEPYRIRSYEAGWNGRFQEGRLEADASVFYTRIDHLHNIVFESFSFPVSTLKFHMYDDAIARGAELRMKHRFSRSAQVYANYTYETVSDRAGDAGQVTRNTPAHKLNAGGRAALGRGFAASADLGYKDSYTIQAVSGGAVVAVGSYWRLDAKISYAPPSRPDVELFVAGSNLLRERHVEFSDGLSVPRTVSGGVTVRLGSR